MEWDEVVDVLCVGSGAGGLTAAITAADNGAKVLLVEKDTKIGGVTGISSGQCWLGGNSLAAKAGIPDSREETLQYLDHLSQGLANPELRDVFMDGGNTVVDYLTNDIGIPFNVVVDYPDYYYPAVEGSKGSGRYLEVSPFKASELGEWADRCIITSYGAHYAYTTSQEWIDHQAGRSMIWEQLEQHVNNDERCAGAGLAAHMLKALLDRNVDIWLESGAQKLIIEEGNVIGAEVHTSEGIKRVKTEKGVLLATGGYDWNKQMVTQFEALPEFGSMCPPTVEGDHLVMAGEAGALPLPSRAPSQTPVFIGYKVPTEEVYGHPSYRMLLPGTPHSMIVNNKGKRFSNDSFYPDVATKVGRFDGQEQGMANWPAWLVFDQDMLDGYGLLPFFPGQGLPEEMGLRADSLAELAELAGIDVSGLLAEVERFNGFCETGVDPDFKRGEVPWGRIMTGDPRLAKNHNLAPVGKAPFYAVKIERVVMGVPTSGLQVDKNANVINSRGDAIPGLYAAGNSTSWLDIGGGYNSGIANTRGLVQGYMGVKHMLGES